jgi:hypothetical protein
MLGSKNNDERTDLNKATYSTELCIKLLNTYSKENDIEEARLIECSHIVKFFDSTLEGRLHYTDFLQIVLPCDN